MPTDPHGQVHMGTYGLFDDPDELAQATAQEEAHEIERLKAQIRRQERHDRNLERKKEKAAKRAASGKAPKSRLSAFFSKVFGTTSSARADEAARLLGKDEDADRAKGVERRAYKIVRRPVTPEPVYHAEDVDVTVNSPFLSECGMVKVRSDGVGGCHIVSKTDIEKSD